MAKAVLEEKELRLAYFFVQPSRPILITTMNPDGGVNAAPASWISPASEHPPMFTVALLTKPAKQHTLQNIERTHEFVLNVPGLDLAERLVASSYDYPEGHGKFSLMGYRAIPSLKVEPPGIDECRANLECCAHQMLPVGDHTLIIAEVVAAHYDRGLFTDDLLLRIDKTFPCLHFKRYRMDDRQAHVFLAPSGYWMASVPYP
ncbi:MAG: flavin reductase family protein [Firmicutes bacterium]|nr:flavin reductase family protein [Bacillota bacterium]